MSRARRGRRIRPRRSSAPRATSTSRCCIAAGPRSRASPNNLVPDLGRRASSSVTRSAPSTSCARCVAPTSTPRTAYLSLRLVAGDAALANDLGVACRDAVGELANGAYPSRREWRNAMHRSTMSRLHSDPTSRKVAAACRASTRCSGRRPRNPTDRRCERATPQELPSLRSAPRGARRAPTTHRPTGERARAADQDVLGGSSRRRRCRCAHGAGSPPRRARSPGSATTCEDTVTIPSVDESVAGLLVRRPRAGHHLRGHRVTPTPTGCLRHDTRHWPCRVATRVEQAATSTERARRGGRAAVDRQVRAGPDTRELSCRCSSTAGPPSRRWRRSIAVAARALPCPSGRRALRAAAQRVPHRFTVDRHLLETANRHASAGRVSRPDLLVLAGLLHDIGKGATGGDHTESASRSLRRSSSEWVRAGPQTHNRLSSTHLFVRDSNAPRPRLPRDHPPLARSSAMSTCSRCSPRSTEADSLATGPTAWGPSQGGSSHCWWNAPTAYLRSGDEVRPTSRARHRALPHRRALHAAHRSGTHIEGNDNTLTVMTDDRPGVFSRIAGVLALQGLDVTGADATPTTPGAPCPCLRCSIPSVMVRTGHGSAMISPVDSTTGSRCGAGPNAPAATSAVRSRCPMHVPPSRSRTTSPTPRP